MRDKALLSNIKKETKLNSTLLILVFLSFVDRQHYSIKRNIKASHDAAVRDYAGTAAHNLVPFALSFPPTEVCGSRGI